MIKKKKLKKEKKEKKQEKEVCIIDEGVEVKRCVSGGLCTVWWQVVVLQRWAEGKRRR